MAKRAGRPDLVADAALKRAAQRNFDKIRDSHVFCVLFNESMVEKVVPLLQMGLAVYLDKPICLLVPRGATVPINLRRMATAIEEFDPTDLGSLEAASVRLLKHD